MKTYDSKTLGKVTVPDSPVERTIAGHTFKLEAGTRYIASRPFADRGRKVYPVSIRRLVGDGDQVPGTLERTDPDVVVDGLTYDQANELLAAFNNGVSSFSGRLW
jgi:hypothetical protein